MDVLLLTQTKTSVRGVLQEVFQFALEFRCFRVWVKYSRNKRYYISADHRLDHKQSTPIHGHESQTIPIGYLITNTHTRNLSRKQTKGNKTYKMKKGLYAQDGAAHLSVGRSVDAPSAN